MVAVGVGGGETQGAYGAEPPVFTLVLVMLANLFATRCPHIVAYVPCLLLLLLLLFSLRL